MKQIDEIQTSAGVLRVISPTDCVKDRLTWYYRDKDIECLRQAILVANSIAIDLKEIERWSKTEGKVLEFARIKVRLQNVRI